jgi:hypothetical protein
VSLVSSLKHLHLLHLSQPAGDRPIYQLLERHPVRRIVEVGIGDGLRATRMIGLLERKVPLEEIHYAGIDLFEAGRKPGGASLSLRDAHKLLRGTGCRLRLVPGDPLTALRQSANILRGTELLLISASQDQESLAKAWFYIPRMLTPQSLVWHEIREKSGLAWHPVPRTEWSRRANASGPHARRAG